MGIETIKIDIDTEPALQKVEELSERMEQMKMLAETSMASFEEVMKKGARHSAGDTRTIQAMHDSAVVLGAKCGDAAKAVAAMGTGLETVRFVPPTNGSLKALALDTLVAAVQGAFWDLRSQIRLAQKPYGVEEYDWWDWDDDLVPHCVAVFDGYAIARIGLTHFKVPYTIGDYDVELSSQTAWETVEQEWVAKNVPIQNIRAAQFREIGVVKNMGGGRLGNYLVLWGDGEKRDLYGEYFTKSTEGLTAIFEYIGKVPALYQHAMDGQVKYTPVGVIDKMEIDDIGLWTETQLDLANQYASAVQTLARKRALGASSGTLPGARKATSDGEIKQWVIIEGSFTPHPAEPRMRELPVGEVKAIYAELGLELPEQVKAAEDRGAEEAQAIEAQIALEQERLRLLELES